MAKVLQTAYQYMGLMDSTCILTQAPGCTDQHSVEGVKVALYDRSLTITLLLAIPIIALERLIAVIFRR